MNKELVLPKGSDGVVDFESQISQYGVLSDKITTILEKDICHAVAPQIVGGVKFLALMKLKPNRSQSRKK